MRPSLAIALACAALAGCSHDHQGDDGPSRIVDRGSAAVDQLIEDVARLEAAAATEREPALKLVERDAKALAAHESAREALVVARRVKALDPDTIGGRYPRLARIAASMEAFAKQLQNDADALLRADPRHIAGRGAEVDRSSTVLRALLQAFRYELAEVQREIEH